MIIKMISTLNFELHSRQHPGSQLVHLAAVTLSDEV